MPDAELEANIQTVVEAVCAHRKPVLGPFINRAVMMVVPGETFFPIQVDAFVPKPTEEEIEKVSPLMDVIQDGVESACHGQKWIQDL